MNKVPMQLLQLSKNESLFLAGKNFGDKVKVGDKGVTDIFLDMDTGLAHVVCDGQEAWVKGYMNINPKKELGNNKPLITHHAMTANIARAQVETPHSAQVETPIQKIQGRPGRPPKYQGQEKPE